MEIVKEYVMYANLSLTLSLKRIPQCASCLNIMQGSCVSTQFSGDQVKTCSRCSMNDLLALSRCVIYGNLLGNHRYKYSMQEVLGGRLRYRCHHHRVWNMEQHDCSGYAPIFNLWWISSHHRHTTLPGRVCILCSA